jgi:hypothetical protein
MAFLLINVFFGIVGTFWLWTENRRSEIGLRMAIGSSKFIALQVHESGRYLSFFAHNYHSCNSFCCEYGLFRYNGYNPITSFVLAILA